MITNKRHELIMKEIKRKNAVTVTDLVDMLDTSESTIRRDLLELDRQGLLRRVHGGATAISRMNSAVEDDVDKRQIEHPEEKDGIARYAAKLVEANDFVYIDAGTSTLKFIEYLDEKTAIYITNGLLQAQALLKKGFKVQIVGGEIRNVTGAVTGAKAVASISHYNFTKGFFGTNGIDIQYGFTTVDSEEAAIKETALQRSLMAYVLADHSKFQKVTPVRFAHIDDAIIITDHCPDENLKKHTSIVEVQL
ncbi:DeoR/GlpR family DNA-binding transcription regulator [[Eubacterium] hominis]|uniref:DeoR/GlpR family DNA-binding transcription regulator n=1 Tax=[Eubacterium] hominis TaxID=2764325 RepID=UPI003A4E2BB9